MAAETEIHECVGCGDRYEAVPDAPEYCPYCLAVIEYGDNE